MYQLVLAIVVILILGSILAAVMIDSNPKKAKPGLKTGDPSNQVLQSFLFVAFCVFLAWIFTL